MTTNEDEEEYEYEEDDHSFELDAEEEYALFCKCGAWSFDANGNVRHVADCVCGAQ